MPWKKPEFSVYSSVRFVPKNDACQFVTQDGRQGDPEILFGKMQVRMTQTRSLDFH